MSVKDSIYVQCNPLLDVTAEVTPDFLSRHHLKRDEEYIYHPGFKGLFEELEASGKAVRTPGGAGLNTARVAQWLLMKAGPQATAAASSSNRPTVTYVGCVGDDSYGKELRAQAEQDGVSMCLEVTAKAPTGTCAVCKVDQSRSMVANLGAANELTAAHLSTPAVQAALANAAVVYTTAYATPFHAKQTLKLAAATRVIGSDGSSNAKAAATDDTRPVFAFGLSSKNIMDVFGEDLVDLLNKMDCIFGNADEIRDLATMLQWDPDEGMTDAELVAKLAREMLYDGHTVRRVVMTRGAQPVLYATSTGECGEVPAGKTCPGAQKHRCTGAGDAFVGGFLAAFVSGHRTDTKRCVEAGVKAATYVISHSIKSLSRDSAPPL